MLIAVMAITVVAVMGTSIAVMATRSTRAAGDAQTAGIVKDLANAGLAQGVTYLRQVGVTSAIDAQAPVPNGVASACQAPTVNTTTPAWTRSQAALITSGSQGSYAVWIEKVAPPVAATRALPGLQSGHVRAGQTHRQRPGALHAGRRRRGSVRGVRQGRGEPAVRGPGDRQHVRLQRDVHRP